MDKEEKLRLDQNRAQQATNLLEDELLNKVLDDIEHEIIQQWENAPARDAEGKEMLWNLYKTSKKFRSVLKGYIENGKLATEQLKPAKPTVFSKLRQVL